MILSVVIVSYNVRFFLEQCLSSLKKAVDGSSSLRGQTEIFIVDNESADGSFGFLAPLYPEFHFIQNKENTGFAKANNQALLLCTGEYVLFLNPDTILAEDSLDKCLSFFQSAPDAGALGPRIIDGSGNYLKESKRGFPSPGASFFKMTGLTSLFPRSRTFSAYYMGHLHEGNPQSVDILSGAFMMIKKNVLDKTGGFDERFFMYAEDIDLSFRISQSGHLNYYFPGTTIIHFKGESTKKDFRYVKMFYSAMELFLKKHFIGGRLSLRLFFLRAGIRLHKVLSYFRLPFKRPDGKRGRLRIFIKGEPRSGLRWKAWLEERQVPVSENENQAEEIIYCEGPHQSWKAIISEIAKNKNRFLNKFHGEGTHAAVGSYSSRDRGEVFEI